MNKLIKFSLAITSCLLLFGCDNFNQNKEFSCIGEMTEIHQGTVVPDFIHEYYNNTDTLSLSIKNGYVSLNGSNVLPPAELVSTNKINYGYNFKICKNENHVIDFNNYACDEKNIVLPAVFKKYIGSMNGITNKFTIETFKDELYKSKVIEIRYVGSYSCKVVKPSF